MRRLALLTALCVLPPLATAAETTARLAPTDEQKTTATLVYGFLSNPRYVIHPISMDSVGGPLLDEYMETLDDGRWFLEARDVKEFAPLRHTLGDSIKAKDLEPAFAVFRRLLQRADERLARVPALVEATRDFSAKESMDKHVDRWFDADELDARWRQRIKGGLLELQLAGVAPATARTLLIKHYESMSRRMHEPDASDVVESFLDAFARVGHYGQGYLAPLSTQELLRLNLPDRTTAGAGMALQRQSPYISIASIVPGGPAARSRKLHEGDRLYAFREDGDWVDLVGWELEDVAALVRGKHGSHFSLRVRSPDGAMSEVALVREQVALHEEDAYAEAMDVGGARIEAIRLPSFYLDFAAAKRGDPDARSAHADVARLIDAARERGAQGLVLDLRGNGGGAVIEAVAVSALFIGKQPVVQVRESEGKVQVESGERDAAWTGPLVVLVDEQSAAASEIAAAALQSSGRALIVGQHTYGRGSIQNLVDLDRWPGSKGKQFGQLKITIAEDFLPNGRSLGPGVEPDVVLDAPLPSDARKPADRPTQVPPAPGIVAFPALPRDAMRSAHEKHAAGEANFKAWLAARATMRDEATAPLSLNEAERRAQMARVEPVLAAMYRPEVRDAPLRAAAALAAELAR